MEKQKPNNGTGKSKVAKPASSGKLPPLAPVAPLFRRIDWIVMGLVFVVMWTIYLLTLAPELTLEDSGELCTGSYYAGIPHPPGYPFWAIYSWFWTAILPMGNVAWRVEVGESFAMAMGCGMLALMVSRGSSMLIEGIEELNSITSKWEGTICMVSGFVAGMMVGLDGFVWSESVAINRISLFAVPWLILVLLMLMRWMYAPHQKRYLYLAMLFYGICATIHQTLLLSAMGIEVAIAAAQPRLGRDLFLDQQHLLFDRALRAQQPFHPGAQQHDFNRNRHFPRCRCRFDLRWWLDEPPDEGNLLRMEGGFDHGNVCGFSVFRFIFYEPISGMTVPPMQWGYPRTVEGFFHALSRGQYETSHGTNIFQDPIRFVNQLWYLVQGLSESFSWVFMFVGRAALFVFVQNAQAGAFLDYRPDRHLFLPRRAPGQPAGRGSGSLFGGPQQGILYRFTCAVRHHDRLRADIDGRLHGHALCQIPILGNDWRGGRHDSGLVLSGRRGGQTLRRPKRWSHFHPLPTAASGRPVVCQGSIRPSHLANLILVAMPIIFIIALLVYRNRGPVLILLGLCLIMPVYSGLSHWYKSEQRNHWFGYWFGHDMFTPPFGIYPEMTRDAILFGGTDPGRFCPTYIIFCESFIPHSCQPKEDQKFDRRDVYIITQNALADGTYLDYLRSQYFRSAQHDPPFFRELIKYVLGIPCVRTMHWSMTLPMLPTHVLDVPFTKFGAHVEARRRAEGVYPPVEIYIPSPDDLQLCYDTYREDFQRRAALGQLQPGEGVQTVGQSDGHLRPDFGNENQRPALQSHL